jgi:hypothetical protein
VVKLKELESYNKQDEIRVFRDYKTIRIQFRLIRPLSQAYNIMVYIRGSAGKTEEFKELIRKIILINNYTR